jgi:DnaJ-class molecular chaperone
MSGIETDHYATLGLDRRCTVAQVRAAYRLLAKRHHPDVNAGAADAEEHARELNAAHEILSDPARRRAYDRELDAANTPAHPTQVAKIERNISQDAHLRIDEFIRGTSLDIRVKDPAQRGLVETYQLTVPPETAPGARFKVPRAAEFGGGFVNVRVRALPGFRFKVRGSDLRCDLRITADRATRGGTEMLPSAAGSLVRISIPAGVARGEVVRIPGEGLPKARGGRGDLLVRITYRPEVRISRSSHR